MSATYVSNLTINAGEDFEQTFFLEATDSNLAWDLSNMTVSSQMRKHAGSSSSTSFDATRISPYTSGAIKLKLTSTQTTSLKPGRYVYDIVVTSDSGIKTRVVEGMVLVRQGVTR